MDVLRRHPYRLLFPVGLALAWTGVAHWLLHAMGLLANYRPVFHAIAQMQGFLMCFAAGFLMTAIPRRTRTGPPGAALVLAGAILPAATTVAAWFESLPWSQTFWGLLVVALIVFALRRFTRADAGRRPPLSFLWIPVWFALAIVGSLMTAAIGILGDEYFWVHQLGQRIVLQGLFLGLVIGIGGMLLPLITRGESSADATFGPAWIGHLLAIAALVTSFWVEHAASVRAGYLMRGTVVLVVLLLVGKIGRLPTLPETHRFWVWASAWMLPLGYFLGAAFPLQRKAGLHVVFVGGFALMALSVALHVSWAHGPGKQHRLGAGVPLYGVLLLIAAFLRALVDFDPERFFVWIGAAAATFLAGTFVWATITVRLWRSAGVTGAPRGTRSPRSAP